MRSLFVTLLMAAILLLAFTSWGRQSAKDPKSTRVPSIHSSSISKDVPLHQQRLFQMSAEPDTTWLGNWTFDGANNVCDAQGWTSVDLREQDDTYFHIDDFADLGGGDFGRLVPIEGSQSLWCGTRGDSSVLYCGWATLPGYGSGWEQFFLNPDCYPVTGDVTISFLMTYDMDEDWDFIHVQYDTCNGGDWIEIDDFTGIGSGFYSFTVPDSEHNDTIRFRFHFWSDWGWDDEAGQWNSDGAAILDSITVSDTSGVVLPTELFEVEDVGDKVTVSGNWEADVAPGYGDYAALYHGETLVQEDPCRLNRSCMWAFINGSSVNYECGGFPNQAVVPYGDGLNGRFFIENEIWSPPVPWTGTGNHAELVFDVYKDLNLSALIFYVWHVRSWVDGCPGPWEDTNFLFYGGQKSWFHHLEPIGEYIDPNADSIQVAIGVTDMCWTWCNWLGDGSCHSHSPLIDNVRLYRIDSNGPVWTVQSYRLFQDNFAGDGTLTGTVRADMSDDVMFISSSIRPGDSVVVVVEDPVSELAVDPHTGFGPAIYAYVSVRPPNQLDKIGDALTQDAFRFPVVDNMMYNGVRWDCVRMDTVFNNPGRDYVIRDNYCIDLNDNLFTPGDTVYFFFSAEGGTPPNHVTYWSEFTGTTANLSEAANSPMEFTCLPAGGYLRGGDILYVDGADGEGAQPYFDDTFEMLGLGGLVDRFDIRGAGEGADVGLESRVADVYQQILGCYKKIIWNTGTSRFCIGDGSGYQTKSDDFGLLYTFADNLVTPGGVYLSGDDLSYDWNISSGASATNFRNKYCNFIASGNVGGNPTPRPAISPLAIGDSSSCFFDTVPDSLVAYGGCPVIRDQDIVDATGFSSQYMSYYSQGSGTGAVVGQQTINLNGETVGVLLSGFSFDAIRDDRPAGLPDRVDHMHRIITWLGNEVDTPTGIAGPGLRNTLAQNYPNPFNPTTAITFSIKERAAVSLKIYNVSGQRVRTLVNETKAPGLYHKVTWDGRNDSGQRVASGVYFYRLVTKNFTQTKKMVLLK